MQKNFSQPIFNFFHSLIENLKYVIGTHLLTKENNNTNPKLVACQLHSGTFGYLVSHFKKTKNLFAFSLIRNYKPKKLIFLDFVFFIGRYIFSIYVRGCPILYFLQIVQMCIFESFGLLVFCKLIFLIEVLSIK